MSRRVRVQVKPGSRQGPAVVAADSPDVEYVVHVRERATEGRANRAVEKVVAEHFGVPRTAVTVVRGHTARFKTLQIDD
ncbi:MAG TPA: DUF167 domain-containing protein [Aeromicrobium sp.]|nr:DUF167 domain-containing protein [Aeromicrobium sp.]